MTRGRRALNREGEEACPRLLLKWRLPLLTGPGSEHFPPEAQTKTWAV